MVSGRPGSALRRHSGCEQPGVPSRRRLRILHAAPYLWSGAGKVISLLIEAQTARHELAIVTSPHSDGLRNWPRYDRQLTRLAVRREQFDLFHRDAAAFWTSVQRMTAMLDSLRPDVCHTHAGVPTAVVALARAASSRPDMPLVAHFYSWGVDRPAWMNDMDLWAFRQADVAFCSARAYQDVLVEGGVRRSRLRLLPWGLTVPDAPVASPNRGSQAGPVIGTLGRIERRKGQLELVHAFVRLRARWPEARLDIIGPVAEPHYHARILESVRRLGLEGSVRLTGQVRDPAKFLARLSLYVSLSSDEGQGLAVLESMAHGVPVVALRAAGVEDYLEDGVTGLAADSRSPRPVAALMHRALTDARLRSRLRRNAMALVRRRYSWARTVDEIENTYRRLVERRKNRAGPRA
jgi:glycosyltransferase involved in cell wall biosynthesis